MRPGSIGGDARVFGPGPGVGGRIQEFTWDGELVWDFKFYNAKQLPHHDMTRLPNGNVLLIVWDRKTTEEAIAAGRRPEMTGDRHLLPDSLVEIKPTGKTTGEVVWEWHLWDHLVQDFDKSKANFGNVAEHPELVNINYGEDELPSVIAAKDGKDKPKADGNPAANRPPRIDPDYTHFNGVAYNPDLDQIAVSVWAFSEFWIIDHGTTTAQAASHTGGRGAKAAIFSTAGATPERRDGVMAASLRGIRSRPSHFRHHPVEALLSWRRVEVGNAETAINHQTIDLLRIDHLAVGRCFERAGVYGGGVDEACLEAVASRLQPLSRAHCHRVDAQVGVVDESGGARLLIDLPCLAARVGAGILFMAQVAVIEDREDIARARIEAGIVLGIEPRVRIAALGSEIASLARGATTLSRFLSRFSNPPWQPSSGRAWKAQNRRCPAGNAESCYAATRLPRQ